MNDLEQILSDNNRAAIFVARDWYGHKPEKHFNIVLQFQNDRKLFRNRFENIGLNLCLSESGPDLA